MEASLGFLGVLGIGLGLGLVLGAVVGGALVYARLKDRSSGLELKVTEVLNQNTSLLKENQALFQGASESTQQQNLQRLQLMMDPFKERLKDFERKIEETYSSERSERGNLRGELTKLMDLNLKMSQEANQLTRALRGDIKSQGLWGEWVLENLLENSGLRKDQDYKLQGVMGADQTLRPDAIVYLPDAKQMILDAKVSLMAYDRYLQATTPDEESTQVKALVESFRRHVETLAKKQYHLAGEPGSTPDFVLMFVPLESAFSLITKHKPELIAAAWEKGIAVVCPTTLLTTLKLVHYLWRQERQEKNVIEIAKRGGLLYDKFVGFVQDLQELGDRADQVQKTYRAVMSKLTEGSGNLVQQAEKLRELGAKTEKKLSVALVEKSKTGVGGTIGIPTAQLDGDVESP